MMKRRLIACLFAATLVACAKAPMHGTRDLRYLPHWFSGFSTSVIENSTLITDGKNLYFATAKGRLIAASGKTGRSLWKVHLDGPIDGSPQVAGDVIYVGTVKGTAYALDRKNGKTLWTYHLDREVMGQPARVGEVVFFGTEGGQFYALEAATGKYLWKFKWDYSDKIVVSTFPALAIGKDRILVGFPDGGLTLFSAATGESIWRVSGGSNAQFTDIAWLVELSERVVLSGAYSGVLQAVNVADGSLVWQLDGAASAAPPALDAKLGRLIIAGDKSIQQIDVSTGKKTWEYTTRTPRRWSGLLSLESDLLAATFDGELHMLSKADGILRWRWFFHGPIQGAPVWVQGRAWVLTKKGHLISLRK